MNIVLISMNEFDISYFTNPHKMQKGHEFCFDLAEGNCTRGDQCWYNHNLPAEGSHEAVRLMERLAHYRKHKGVNNKKRAYCRHALLKNGLHDARNCIFDHNLPPEDSQEYIEAIYSLEGTDAANKILDEMYAASEIAREKAAREENARLAKEEAARAAKEASDQAAFIRTVERAEAVERANKEVIERATKEAIERAAIERAAKEALDRIAKDALAKESFVSAVKGKCFICTTKEASKQALEFSKTTDQQQKNANMCEDCYSLVVVRRVVGVNNGCFYVAI